MNKLTSLHLLVMAALFLGGCNPVPEDTRPGKPVKTRQDGFKAMLRVFEPMGTMLRDKRYQPEPFLAGARDLMVKREVPWAHFGADTLYPPSKAKEQVWSDGRKFEQARLDFYAATDSLLAAAQAKQLAEVEVAYYKVYDCCQSCHKAFKEK